MKDWGLDGIVCTDGGALGNLVKDHKAYKALPEALAATIHAGINQFLDTYKPAMQDALKQGLITEADLDRNLRGVFRVMLRLGMLDPNPTIADAAIGYEDGSRSGMTADPWMLPASHALARTVTDESIVLLKNISGTLPLDSSRLHSMAVIGPYADKVLLDWYSGTPPYAVPPLEGIRARAGAGVRVTYTAGDDLSAVTTAAKSADVAVVVIGNHPTCGAGWNQCPTPSDGKESVDRKTLSLAQEEMAKAALAGNPHTILVLQASFPFTTNWSEEHVPAILEMTHNSQEQGNALADVLFGDYNPAGRLTQTWVRDEADLPPMMDYNIRDGRTYMYAKQKPLYPFGFGLSYTRFQYSNLRVSGVGAHGLGRQATAQVTIDVKNTGARAGDEVVQMYVRHRGSAVQRPLEELKGFARIHLNPGETRPVTLPLAAQALAYWQSDTHRFSVEPDTVQVNLGGSSDNLPLQTTIQVTP
jgi:beta-glucosidase